MYTLYRLISPEYSPWAFVLAKVGDTPPRGISTQYFEEGEGSFRASTNWGVYDKVKLIKSFSFLTEERKEDFVRGEVIPFGEQNLLETSLSRWRKLRNTAVENLPPGGSTGGARGDPFNSPQKHPEPDAICSEKDPVEHWSFSFNFWVSIKSEGGVSPELTLGGGPWYLMLHDISWGFTRNHWHSYSYLQSYFDAYINLYGGSGGFDKIPKHGGNFGVWSKAYDANGNHVDGPVGHLGSMMSCYYGANFTPNWPTGDGEFQDGWFVSKRDSVAGVQLAKPTYVITDGKTRGGVGVPTPAITNPRNYYINEKNWGAFQKKRWIEDTSVPWGGAANRWSTVKSSFPFCTQCYNPNQIDPPLQNKWTAYWPYNRGDSFDAYRTNTPVELGRNNWNGPEAYDHRPLLLDIPNNAYNFPALVDNIWTNNVIMDAPLPKKLQIKGSHFRPSFNGGQGNGLGYEFVRFLLHAIGHRKGIFGQYNFNPWAQQGKKSTNFHTLSPWRLPLFMLKECSMYGSTRIPKGQRFQLNDGDGWTPNPVWQHDGAP